jgi:UDP-2,3-diacylglucosamine hydrolase
VATLFISDLHIDAAHPAITDRFLRFLHDEAAHAEALYILGDLFESWIGDDDSDPAQTGCMQALAELTTGGVPCFVMHGNRDFLLGMRFCSMTGASLLPDPLILTLYGESMLVMHGDALCTDDRAYQRLRATVRDPAWQREFLALSIAQRRTLAGAARSGSQAHTAAVGYSITDVNAGSVEAALRGAGVSILLHGHTHRPAVHSLEVDGRVCARIVLGDWHGRASILRWDAQGYGLISLED